jgi:hypothetical protein
MADSVKLKLIYDDTKRRVRVDSTTPLSKLTTICRDTLCLTYNPSLWFEKSIESIEGGVMHVEVTDDAQLKEIFCLAGQDTLRLHVQEPTKRPVDVETREFSSEHGLPPWTELLKKFTGWGGEDITERNTGDLEDDPTLKDRIEQIRTALPQYLGMGALKSYGR